MLTLLRFIINYLRSLFPRSLHIKEAVNDLKIKEVATSLTFIVFLSLEINVKLIRKNVEFK